jgi:hypothetical protein
MPSSLILSQSSLQDYADCRRRFQLRYLLKVAWPALAAEPVQEHERELEAGANFHRLAQQHLLGVPAERLAPLARGPELSAWWQNYLEFHQHSLAQAQPRRLAVEALLSAPLGGARLLAKYDLVLVQSGGRAVIYDWKTSRHRPKRQWLSERLQTRVYPYLLAEAGAHLNGGYPLPLEAIEMVYWFANFPGEPEHFVYSAAQHQANAAYLGGLVAELQTLPEGDFHLTPHVERCRFCIYRSLCDRGVQAGDVDKAEAVDEDTTPADVDFEQIGEIAF